MVHPSWPKVYVVDEEDRAIGVITLSDVLRALLAGGQPEGPQSKGERGLSRLQPVSDTRDTALGKRKEAAAQSPQPLIVPQLHTGPEDEAPSASEAEKRRKTGE